MSQEIIKKIKVILTVNGEIDILVFIIDEDAQPEGLSVNLNSPESQDELKKVFSGLLKCMNESNIMLVLEIADNYSKTLYIDVAKEYISQLNKELQQTYEEYQKILASNQQ